MLTLCVLALLFLTHGVVSLIRSVSFDSWKNGIIVRRTTLSARRRSNIARRTPADAQYVDKKPIPADNTPSLDANENTNEFQEIDSFETLSEEGDGIRTNTISFSDLQAELAKDFAELRNSDNMPDNKESQRNSGAELANTGKGAINSIITKVLIVDFLVVVAFLLWFLLAVVLKSSYPVVLERFQDVFQPVVVPALTVLMVGSIASGVSEKLAERRSTNNKTGTYE